MTYDPDFSSIPHSIDEIEQCKLMEPTKVLIGQHVLYRHNHFEDVVDAIVLDIADDHPRMIWRQGFIVEIPPWPSVEVESCWGTFTTRQARIRGSAGWMPLSWLDEPSPQALMAQILAAS